MLNSRNCVVVRSARQTADTRVIVQSDCQAANSDIDGETNSELVFDTEHSIDEESPLKFAWRQSFPPRPDQSIAAGVWPVLHRCAGRAGEAAAAGRAGGAADNWR